MTPEINKLIDAIKEQITPEAIAKTKEVFDNCPGEILLMATAFRELAEYAKETANDENADGFIGHAEEAQQRADAYAACYAEIVKQFGGDLTPVTAKTADWPNTHGRRVDAAGNAC